MRGGLCMYLTPTTRLVVVHRLPHVKELPHTSLGLDNDDIGLVHGHGLAEAEAFGAELTRTRESRRGKASSYRNPHVKMLLFHS